jgi:hypothetical protein
MKRLQLITLKSLVFCSLFLFQLAQAQVTTSPLGSNPVIENFLNNNPDYQFQPNLKTKFGTRDTLSLPFFDDFSESSIYPDSTKWLNNEVFINNNLPFQPPTYNVATFDGLDTDGRPYQGTINTEFNAPGDSLISQPINLKEKNGYNFSISDSIILSFFYQPNGYGYHLSGEDSLRLFFKAVNGNWFQMWSVGGQSTTEDFKHVSVPVLDVNYLHDGFQFMFTTHTRRVGNANHWHIDYVFLDSVRSNNVDYYDDYAIQTTPSSLLKNYTSMPFEHFKVNRAAHTADSMFFRVSNLDKDGKFLEVRHEDFNDGNLLASTMFSVHGHNVLPKNSDLREINAYSLNSINGSLPVIINRTVMVEDPGVPNKYRKNDTLIVDQVFDDYYAYDDGSAERGIGFDQNTNPSNIEGQIAMGFDVVKEDRLFAIGTYFNEAVYDVSGRRFKYRIWRSLNGVDGAPEDTLIYESGDMTPEYRTANGLRTFSPHYLDTNLTLKPGKYYVGWWQQDMYNLNVGWDMNYGNRKNPDVANPDLYYNTFNDWSNVEINGTMMMRLHFGDSAGLYLKVDEFKSKSPQPRVYPNPAKNIVHFGKEYSEASLVSMKGEVLARKENIDSLQIEGIENGIYFVKLVSESGEHFTVKLVILAQ